MLERSRHPEAVAAGSPSLSRRGFLMTLCGRGGPPADEALRFDAAVHEARRAAADHQASFPTAALGRSACERLRDRLRGAGDGDTWVAVQTGDTTHEQHH